MGVALGASCGMIPMNNLVSAGLLIAILFLPVHQLSACLALIVVGGLSSMLAPIPDALGVWILSHAWIQTGLANLHAFPVMPWLRLNNSMVIGGSVLGVGLVAPIYWTLRWTARRTQQHLADWAVAQLAEEASRYRKTIATASRLRRMTIDPPHARRSPEEIVTRPRPGAPTTPLLPAPSPAVPTPVATLAAPLAATPKRVDAHHVTPAPATPSETVLRETIIEVVRLRTPSASRSSSSLPTHEPMILEKTKNAESEPSNSAPMSFAHAQATLSANAPKRTFDPGHQPLAGPKSAESLKYLIKYLATHQTAHDNSETRS